MTPVCKYRILLQARTDLTESEIAQYQASKGPNGNSPCVWPWRDTGEILHARRRNTATAFYRALKQIPPLIKVRAVRLPLNRSHQMHALEFVRAWLGFNCLCGSIGGVEDEVKHFEVSSGQAACGLDFSANHWTVHGKPECDKCLTVAVEQHPGMKQFL